MVEESDNISCKHCDLYVVKLYEVINKRVCRYCKKDYELNGMFTRKKVKHNYSEANDYVLEAHKLKKKGKVI